MWFGGEKTRGGAEDAEIIGPGWVGLEMIIRGTAQVEQSRESRIRWFGHLQRREMYCTKHVEYGASRQENTKEGHRRGS